MGVQNSLQTGLQNSLHSSLQTRGLKTCIVDQALRNAKAVYKSFARVTTTSRTQNKQTTQTAAWPAAWALAKIHVNTQPSAKHLPGHHAAPARPLRKGRHTWRTKERACTHSRYASRTGLPRSDADCDRTPLSTHTWTRTCQNWSVQTLTRP